MASQERYNFTPMFTSKTPQMVVDWFTHAGARDLSGTLRKARALAKDMSVGLRLTDRQGSLKYRVTAAGDYRSV